MILHSAHHERPQRPCARPAASTRVELPAVGGCKRTPRHGPGQEAFTLVELLVVITIIVLLLAMLLPSFGRVRAWTRLTLCQTRLNAQVKGHQLYAASNEDRKPPLITYSSRGRPSFWWSMPNTKMSGHIVGQGLLVNLDYLPFEALLCPSSNMVDDAAIDRESWNRRSTSGSSYEYFWRHVYRLPPGDTPEERAGKITYSAQLADGWAALAMDVNAEPPSPYSSAFGVGERIEGHPTLKKTNVGYIGGAVKAFSSEELLLRTPGWTNQKLGWWTDANGGDVR